MRRYQVVVKTGCVAYPQTYGVCMKLLSIITLAVMATLAFPTPAAADPVVVDEHGSDPACSPK